MGGKKLVFVLRTRCCGEYVYFGDKKQQEDKKLQCISCTVQQSVGLKEDSVDKSHKK
jgi:hypothetical protein